MRCLGVRPDTRPIGANDRNGVGAYCIRPTKRAPGPEWMYRPARIRPHRVPGPPRVSPWAMIHRAYSPAGYPGRNGIRPPKRAHGPEWDVPGPPRVSPWAMVHRAYSPAGYMGAACRAAGS